jgi:hypothetical protein
MTPEILAVIGGLVTLGLTINAFFIKSLVDSVNDVKILTATLVQKSLTSEKDIAANTEKIEMLRTRTHDLGVEVHRILLKMELENK